MNRFCSKLLIVAMASMLPLASGCSAASKEEKQSEPAASAEVSTAPVEKDTDTKKETEASQAPASEAPAQSEKAESSPAGNTASDPSAKTKTVGDFEVTMESASAQSSSGPFTPEDGNTYIVTVFKITNNSDETVEISSGMNFEAFADGQDIFQAWTVDPEGVDWIDGNVEPGQSIEGCVCFEAPADFSEITVSFYPDTMSKDGVTFTINH